MNAITWTVTHPDTTTPPTAGLDVAPVLARDAVPTQSERVARLAARSVEAAQIRALTTHPDVIALRVERVRTQVDALLWAGIMLGLAFTMVNVQTFAATDAPVGSLAWWVAWLLDPMVSLVLLAVLRAEQVTARYQVPLPAWGRRTKWLTFAATYVMNTWTSWGLADRPLSWSGIVLHSVPPLVVFATAETGPGLRDRLTEAVHRALTEHLRAGRHSTGGDTDPLTTPPTLLPAAPVESVHEPVDTVVHESGNATTHEPVTAPVREPAPRPAHRRAAARGRKRGPGPRRLLADYVTAARVAREDATTEETAPAMTPAWVRQVTGCSAGTSVKVAAALRAEPQPTTTTTSNTPTTTAREGEAA